MGTKALAAAVSATRKIALEDVSIPSIRLPGLVDRSVYIAMQLRRVNFAALVTGAALRTAFAISIKQAVAAEAGFGTQPNRLTVKMSKGPPGSIFAEVKVRPEIGVSSSAILTTLKYSQAGEEVAQAVAHSVNFEQAAKAATLGSVIVSDVSHPSMLPPGFQKKRVSIVLIVNHLSYKVLTESSSLTAAFKESIKKAIAAQTASQVLTQHMIVTFAEGSRNSVALMYPRDGQVELRITTQNKNRQP